MGDALYPRSLGDYGVALWRRAGVADLTHELARYVEGRWALGIGGRFGTRIAARARCWRSGAGTHAAHRCGTTDSQRRQASARDARLRSGPFADIQHFAA